MMKYETLYVYVLAAQRINAFYFKANILGLPVRENYKFVI